MKNILTKFAFVFAIALLFTACPKPTGDNEITGDSLTEKIAAAQTSIDFEGAEIAEDAVVAKKITVKNLKLGGKTLTIKASGTELVNVSNAIIIIDQQVGDGDVTLAGCSSINKLVVNGGGSNSIHIKNSKVANVEVKKDAVRVAMEGTSEVDSVVVNAANTKIESDEKIEIKEITVNETIDKVTVKGGTVKKLEVVPFDDAGVPMDAPSTTPDSSQSSAQIIIDGKADIQSIEGTEDVTLTEEAVEQGATINIVSDVPKATLYNSILVFTSNGTINDPELENQDYFYEYVFNYETDVPEISAMGYKIKIYKINKNVKFYIYMDQEIPESNGKHSQMFIESNTNSILFEDMYESALNLENAGLVKGAFTEEIPDSPYCTYYDKFDVSNCGMPARIVLPENPYKPTVKIEATSQGNKITVSHAKVYYKRIDIIAAEKDGDTWKPTKNKIFNFEDYNNENPPSSILKVFVDSYVTPGKEYAYYVDTDKYDTTTQYYTSNKNLYIAAKATGGLGEIQMQAEATDDGIKLTVPYFPETADTVYFDSLLRTSTYNNNTQHINNLNNLQGQSAIDYFVTKGKEYTYTLDNQFWYKNENYRYHPHSNTCTVISTRGGYGEAMITNSPVVANMTSGSLQLSSTNNTIQFTTAPVLEISSIPDNHSINISFSYFKKLSERSTTSESFGIDYVPGEETATCDAHSLVEHFPNSTLENDNFYEVYIRNSLTRVTYQYFAHNAQFAGLPGTLIIQ